MEYMWNDKISRNSLFKKFLLAILFIPSVLIALVGITMVVSVYYSFRFLNEEIFFINSSFSIFPIVFSVSSMIFLFLKLFRPLDSKFEQKLTLIAMVVGFLFGTISLFSFNQFTLNGINSYSLLGNKEYSFLDVSRYTVSPASDDTLKIEFEMNDKKKFVFTGGISNAVGYESADISTLYAEDPYAEYIIYTAEIMKKNRVKANILSKSEIEDLGFDYWVDIAKNIQNIYK